MMNLLIGTISTGISFGLFAVLPQFIINMDFGTEKIRERVVGACWVVAAVEPIWIGVHTQKAAWVVGGAIGFFLSVGLSLFLVRLMIGSSRKDNY